MSSFENVSVLVTGGTRGIGRAIVAAFAQGGAKVTFTGTNEAAAEEAKAASGAADQCHFVKADVSTAEGCQGAVDAAVEFGGGLDVVVNNAGIVSPMLHFFDADEAWWRRIVDVNLTGHFLVSHPAARIMAKQGGGCIINMSSGGATRAHRSFTAYDATKGGIEALTRAMAVDLAPYGIRVNALMPGSIDTSSQGAEYRQKSGVNIPLGRVGDPGEMAGAALFLASDDAGYITGDVIKVDGGMLAQQRSATVDIVPPSTFPAVEDL